MSLTNTQQVVAMSLWVIPEDPRGFAKYIRRGYARVAYAAAPEKILKRNRKYSELNPEVVQAAKDRYGVENRERLNAESLRRSKTPERRRAINIRKRAYRKQRRKEDPAFKLTEYARTRVWKALRGVAKSSGTSALLGTDYPALLRHLEAQFLPGMTWSNYGDWHVDHKRPCAAFDLTDPAQQRECFHYSNLQPLWAIDNIRKGARV